MGCLGAGECSRAGAGSCGATRSAPLAAATAALLLALAVPASAQHLPSGSKQVGDAVISVGGGTAVLYLPDVTSMMTGGQDIANLPVDRTFKFSDDFGDEFGWNVNGSIAVPVDGAVISLGGFWANIEDDHGATCVSDGPTYCAISPLTDDPAVSETSGFARPGEMFSTANRDVDQWGASLESEWEIGRGAGFISKQYFAIGADVRGIDQDLNARFTSTLDPGYLVTYSEQLDARYYGAYLSWGGEYSLFGGLWKSWGLVSSFRLHGGIYYADADYEGRMTQVSGLLTFDPTSSLSLSRDDVAFIGGITLETRKRIGPRTSVSLKSDYEYYSWVPDMTYNTADGPAFADASRDVGTRMGDDDAFSMRTSLRLNIGLGPDDLYRH